ncbi:MAG: sensor histidine kinase [Pseudomonadota bacterium]
MFFRSLAFKLPAYVTVIVIMALTISGYLIDRNLLAYHRSAAENTLAASIQRIKSALSDISDDMHEEAQWLESQARVLAALSLIRDFEDPENYQAIVFNPEKQRIADDLQALIQNGRANSAYVFSLDNQLVSYALQGSQGLEQGIVSFDQGTAKLLQNTRHTDDSDLLSLAAIKDGWQAVQHQNGNYHIIHGVPYYIHVQPLTRKDQTLGTLVLAYALNEKVFQQVLTGGVQARLINKADALNQYSDQPQQLLETTSLLRNDSGFWQYQGFASQSALPGALLHYPASQYHEEQRITRDGLILAMLVTALLVVPLSLWRIRRLILTPLNQLMRGIATIGAGQHQPVSSTFSVRELDHLAQTLNQMASQLQHRERRLKDYAQEMERLTQVMAHHFQEPSRRLMMFSSQLEHTHLDDPQDRQAVEFINAQATRLSTLVEGARQYLELTQTPPELTSVDLNDLVNKLLSTPPLANRLQQLDANSTVSPLPIVIGDRRRLYQLFEILLDNACRYRQVKKYLYVKLWAEERPDHWQVFIQDNGVGIAPEHHDQAFSLFTRLVTDSEQPGIGLGLAMARQIMRQLDGELSIDDSCSEGTTFRLLFVKGISNARGA